MRSAGRGPGVIRRGAVAAGVRVGLFLVLGLPAGNPAGAALLSGVQSGTATSSASGTVTVPIAAVDPARSFLVFQLGSNGNRLVNSTLRGRLASPITLEFIRQTNETTPSPIEIRWYVASFASGVLVQRGDTAVTAATINVPITAVPSLEQAFVLLSKSSGPTETGWNASDPHVAELTALNNLQLRVTSAATTQTISWQVVQFTNPADVRVQKGTTSLTGSALSASPTLSVPVDPDRTFVLVGYRVASTATGNDVGARMLRAQLTNATTITIDRSIAGSPDAITEIAWQAVELRDGSTVRRGSAAFATGQAQQTAALVPEIDPASSLPFAAVQPAPGQSMGRSSLSTTTVIGVGTATMTLSATQVTMTRNNTAAPADVGWFVVQFPRRRVALIQ